MVIPSFGGSACSFNADCSVASAVLRKLKKIEKKAKVNLTFRSEFLSVTAASD